MTNLRNYEQPVDECTEILMQKLGEVEGQAVDFTEWLQWYTFDVISSITFQTRLGFLEKKGDVHGLIEGGHFFAFYFGVIGQLPWLHRYLLGSLTFTKVYKMFAPDAPDTLRNLFTVSVSVLLHSEQNGGNTTDT
jgi:hypothetical protein